MIDNVSSEDNVISHELEDISVDSNEIHIEHDNYYIRHIDNKRKIDI